MKLPTQLWNEFASKVEDYIDEQPPVMAAMTLDQCMEQIRKLAELPLPEVTNNLLRLAQLTQLAYDSTFFNKDMAMKYVQVGRAVRAIDSPMFVLSSIQGDLLTSFLNANYKVEGVPSLAVTTHYMIVRPDGQLILSKNFPETYADGWRLASDEEIREVLQPAKIVNLQPDRIQKRPTGAAD